MPTVTATLEARWIDAAAVRFATTFKRRELPRAVAQLVSAHLSNQGIRMTGDSVDAVPVGTFTYTRQSDGSWIIEQEQS